MVVRAHAVHDQYCELPKDTVDAFLNAPSMGRYFKREHRRRPDKSGPYDCRTRKGVMSGNAVSPTFTTKT